MKHSYTYPTGETLTRGALSTGARAENQTLAAPERAAGSSLAAMPREQQFTVCRGPSIRYFVVSLALVCLLLWPRSTQANCRWVAARAASGYVFEAAAVIAAAGVVLGPAGAGLEAFAAGLVLGAAGSQAAAWVATFWWDPVNPISSLRPPGQIYTGISDPNIDAMIPYMIHNLGFSNTVTANDILSADALQPGLGTHTLAWLRAEVRLMVAAFQGAAAYNMNSQSDLSQAYNAMLTQQSVLRNEMAQVASLAAMTRVQGSNGDFYPLESTPTEKGFLPTATLDGFLQFTSNVRTMGAAGLPPGEVANVQMLLAAAQTVVPFDIGSPFAEWAGDNTTCPASFQFEVDLFMAEPSTELTVSQLLTNNVGHFFTTMNLQESPLAVPRITGFTRAGNSFALTWTALVNSRYQVQFTPDLNQAFANYGGPITATAPITTRTVPRAGAQGYFRVALLP
jgi:hypothetical protein